MVSERSRQRVPWTSRTTPSVGAIHELPLQV